jgi:hypothetical protein
MNAKIIPFLLILFIPVLPSCLTIEEEPILLIQPTAEISAHIKDHKIFATSLISVNPQVLFAGNIPTVFEFSGETAIYNTANGVVIDVTTFSGGGLAKVYTVSADTSVHKRFVVITSGTIDAYADIGNDQDSSNDKLISSGDFYQEAQFVISEMIRQTNEQGSEAVN